MLVNSIGANRQGLGFGEIKCPVIIKGGDYNQRANFYYDKILKNRQETTAEFVHCFSKDRSQLGAACITEGKDLNKISFDYLENLKGTVVININSSAARINKLLKKLMKSVNK